MHNMFSFGKKTGRRQGHISRQMKYFGGPKFRARAENSLWKMVRTGRDRKAMK